MMSVLTDYFQYYVIRPANNLKQSLKLHNERITAANNYDDIDYWEFNERVLAARTTKWLKRCWKHHLELPPRNSEEYWDDRKFDRGKVLNDNGVRFLRRQYREELAAQREPLLKWLTLIFAAIAATGTVFKYI